MPTPDLCAVCGKVESFLEIGNEYTCKNKECIHKSRERQGLIKRPIKYLTPIRMSDGDSC